MERKLIDITLPRMEDRPKSWNTQRDKGPLIKLMVSWITEELRRITLTKIDEIKLVYLKEKYPNVKLTFSLLKQTSSLLQKEHFFVLISFKSILKYLLKVKKVFNLSFTETYANNWFRVWEFLKNNFEIRIRFKSTNWILLII